MSLGHSLATAAQADEAFSSGATIGTHAFNAMPPQHQREPGLLGAAINHPTISVGVQANLLRWFKDQNTGEMTANRLLS